MYVLRDANVTDREMEFLRNLRTQLGLSEAQARTIEESVERTLKVDAPQTGASAGTDRAFVAAAAAEVDFASVEVRRADERTQSPVATRAAAVRAAANPGAPKAPARPATPAAPARKATPAPKPVDRKPSAKPAPSKAPAKKPAAAPKKAAKSATGGGPQTGKRR
jgi:hypothetical protein